MHERALSGVSSLVYSCNLMQPARSSIRRRYAEGEVSLADLATEYSVGRSTIHRIIHGSPENPR